jgi:hypothetical protein
MLENFSCSFRNGTFELSDALSLGTNSFQKTLEAGQANFGIIDIGQSKKFVFVSYWLQKMC